MTSSRIKIFKSQIVNNLPLRLVQYLQYLKFYVYNAVALHTGTVISILIVMSMLQTDIVMTLHVFVICHFSRFVASTMCIHF